MLSSEMLHSILIAPTDLDNDQIAMTILTHAARKGMSVLRGVATDEEFRKIIRQRIKDASKQQFHGVAPLLCADVRSLIATENGEQRQAGDRLYCVLDTDMSGLPHHADVFVTMPRPHKKRTPKAAWRLDREKLMELMLRDFVTAETFRGGALANANLNEQR